jgi:hypothetical protein
MMPGTVNAKSASETSCRCRPDNARETLRSDEFSATLTFFELGVIFSGPDAWQPFVALGRWL